MDGDAYGLRAFIGAFFTSAVLNGLVLSGVLTVLSFVFGGIAKDAFVDKYPRAIRDRFGPMSARAARLKPWFALGILGATLAVPLLGVEGTFLGKTAGGWEYLLPVSAFAATSLLTFNVFDLLVLDWLLFCTVRPKAMLLPGTEGMAEYRDYGFHFIGFLKGLVFTVVGALLVASAWMLWKALS